MVSPKKDKPSSNPRLHSALAYAALGWRVVPLHHVENGKCTCNDDNCKTAGKHPRTKHGSKDGTTDADAIRQWWERWPSANVGVCTGPESGIWVLGPDGEKGIAELSDLVRKYTGLPRTPKANSGSGGAHHVFRWPPDGKIKNRRNHRDSSIDVRGEGGLFVAAPSVNGVGPYVWEIPPEKCELADAPKWLLAWVRGDGKGKNTAFTVKSNADSSIADRAIAYINKMPPAISGQGGHDQTMEAARVVVYGFDLGPEVGYQILDTHYNPRCQPPWSEKELRHKCAEANTVPFSKPRGWLLTSTSTRTSTSTTGQKKNNGRQAEIDTESALETTPLSTLRPRPIKWLERNRIPLGKVVLIAGDGGHGKSTLTLHLAACLSQGLPAFGLSCDEHLTGDTLLIQCEDDWSDTVVPRLLAMGADMARIHQQHGIRNENGELVPFCLAHYQALERTLAAKPEIKLVVIDPAGAYIGSGVDDHKDSELRSLLGPLAELAARRGVTIILVKHFSKAPTAKAVSKISGSTGYVNAVRAAYVVLPDQDDPERALLLPVKFNIGRRPKGLTYRRESMLPAEVDALLQPFEELSAEDRQRIGETIFHLRWEGETDATADNQLADAMRAERGPKKTERCAAWMKTFLAKYAYPSDEILAAAKEQGYTFDNVKEAKATLKEDGLRSTNRGEFQGVWWCGFGEPYHWTRRPEKRAPHSPHSPHNGGIVGTDTDNLGSPSPHCKNTVNNDVFSNVGKVGSEDAWIVPDADPGALENPFEGM
jgi:hypothetical protein